MTIGRHGEEAVYQETTTDPCHTAQEIRLRLGTVIATAFISLTPPLITAFLALMKISLFHRGCY